MDQSRKGEAKGVRAGLVTENEKWISVSVGCHNFGFSSFSLSAPFTCSGCFDAHSSFGIQFGLFLVLILSQRSPFRFDSWLSGSVYLINYFKDSRPFFSHLINLSKVQMKIVLPDAPFFAVSFRIRLGSSGPSGELSLFVYACLIFYFILNKTNFKLARERRWSRSGSPCA